MTIYRFYNRYRDELTGEWVYNNVATVECDGDAQAELMVNHLRDKGQIQTDFQGRPMRGLTIKRDDVEWYSQGI